MGVIDDIKHTYEGVRSTLKQYDTIGDELHQKAAMALPPAPAANPPAPEAAIKNPPKKDSGKRYGDRPGEKRLDAEGNEMKSYKDGTDFVPKTGPAILHKGEKVVPAEENKMDAKAAMEGITGKKAKKPPKKIKEIRTKMSDNGKVVHTHVHHHPEHHADETHVSDDAAGAAKHMTDMMPQMSAQPPEMEPEQGAPAAMPGA